MTKERNGILIAVAPEEAEEPVVAANFDVVSRSRRLDAAADALFMNTSFLV